MGDPAPSDLDVRPRDTLGRPIRKLRLSVTDRCNLRCAYCMPRESYAWLPREHVLGFDELARLVRLLADLGVGVVRLTGGEPLVRKDLAVLVRRLVETPSIRAVALTTNGLLLEAQAAALRDAGLGGITVSLDTLREDRFAALTRRDALRHVRAGLDAALVAGFERVKTNTVVMRGVNDDELAAIVEHARARRVEPRFIEYMDVGGATGWRSELVVPRTEILERLGRRYGPLRQLVNRDGAPADRFALPDGLVVGVISSTSQPFCRRCDRARVTADGMLLTCLYAETGLDVRALLRGPLDDDALRAALGARWRARTDRGAEVRAELAAARGPWIPAERLRRDPHLEMHKRGG